MVIDRNDRMVATNSDDCGIGFDCSVTILTSIGGGAAGAAAEEPESFPPHAARIAVSATRREAAMSFISTHGDGRDVTLPAGSVLSRHNAAQPVPRPLAVATGTSSQQRRPIRHRCSARRRYATSVD